MFVFVCFWFRQLNFTLQLPGDMRLQFNVKTSG
jgi:hypothetical protein